MPESFAVFLIGLLIHHRNTADHDQITALDVIGTFNSSVSMVRMGCFSCEADNAQL